MSIGISTTIYCELSKLEKILIWGNHRNPEAKNILILRQKKEFSHRLSPMNTDEYEERKKLIVDG
ncbi:MAG: hypothetical protein U9N18_03905 [Campylobacterota bacterium]|nr:hypothetical protein [Campylobacterota bacterium]